MDEPDAPEISTPFAYHLYDTKPMPSTSATLFDTVKT